MRLAHLSDVHLGFRQYYRQTAHGINQREADVAMAFQHAMGDIIAAKPDMVLVAGDLFHTVRPTNPAILHAFNQFRHLRQALPNVPVVLIAGDHDTPRSVETGTILRLFEAVPDVHVVSQDAREIEFADLDLTVVCVPYAAAVAGRRHIPSAQSRMRHRVLVAHFEVAGVLPPERSSLEHGGVVVEPGDLHSEQWSYVALGHYHVAHRVADNAWYAGALEYVTRNAWGELRDEAHEGRPGQKGWLLVDIEDGLCVDFRPVPLARRLIDLPPIQGEGRGATELDDCIASRLHSVADGIRDQIVRQLVFDVPRPIVRDLDHARIRGYKAEALHFNLDIRRPPTVPVLGIATPGRRQPLRELVREYLGRRPLTAEVKLDDLVRLGAAYLDDVENETGDQ